VIDNKSKQVIR